MFVRRRRASTKKCHNTQTWHLNYTVPRDCPHCLCYSCWISNVILFIVGFTYKCIPYNFSSNRLCTSAVAPSWAPLLKGCRILVAARSVGRWQRVWTPEAVCSAALWLALLSGDDPSSPSSTPGHRDSAPATRGTPLPPLISRQGKHKPKYVTVRLTF